MHRIEIVLDDEHSDDQGIVILDELASSLHAVHAALRAKPTQVIPRIHHPEEARPEELKTAPACRR
jgi:hypothetical protein